MFGQLRDIPVENILPMHLQWAVTYKIQYKNVSQD